MNATTQAETTVLELEQSAPIGARVPVVQSASESTLAKAETFMLSLIERGLDMDQIERAMTLKRRMVEMTDEQTFSAALAAFKAEGIVVSKDRDNKQFGSKYTSLGNLIDTVTPYLSKHGLSMSFDQDQSSGLEISCTLSLGLFSKTSRIRFPVDTSGQKNPIQQIKSAITYGRTTTCESVCGLAPSDTSGDDDGNGFGQATMQDAWCNKAASAKTLDELDAIFDGGTKAFTAAKDTRGYAAFAAAGKKRSKELMETARA